MANEISTDSLKDMIEGNNNNSEENSKEINQRPLDIWENFMINLEKNIIFILFPVMLILSLFFVIFSDDKKDFFIGFEVITIAVFVYILYNIFREVPEKEQWLISVFKNYYVTWMPGLHLLLYPIMRIDHKVTIDATKVFDIFMEKDSHRLEFKNGSAGLVIKVMARAMDAYNATYEIKITNEEIQGIEIKEKDEGITKLPEIWMYLAAIKIEAAVRGVCGNLSIDDAIQAKAISSDDDKIEIDPEIIARAVRIASKSLVDYDIVIEQITFSAIALSKKIEEARDAIYIEEKAVEKQKWTLKKQQIEADGEVVKAEGINRALWKIVGDMEDSDGNTLKSKMSFGDAMQYTVVTEAVKHIGEVTVVNSGGGAAIPDSIASQVGAEFGVGFRAVKRGDKNKGDDIR